jgi:DNA-binding transcriptional MerR regulator
MYSIGQFAAAGRISVRMLRHYDAIGLLIPARVDARTGYRQYSNDQLPRLLRIAELRDLGVSLDSIASVFASADENAAFRDVLTARRAEIETSLAAETARLARIDRRLRILEGKDFMLVPVNYRTIDPVTVYALSGTAPGMGPENVSPVIGQLIEKLDNALTAADRPAIEPGIFWYDTIEGSDEMAVTVSYTAEPSPKPGDGYRIVDLPAIPTAATLIHRGDMSGIGEAWAALVNQLVADGYQIDGPSREVYLEASGHLPQSNWVTELQVPVTRA